MYSDDKTILINKQVLIQAVLELERKESYRYFILTDCLTSLQSAMEKLDNFLAEDPPSRARNKLLNQFLSSEEWGEHITDELFEQWETEFKAGHERDSHPPGPDIPNPSDSSTAGVDTDAPH